MKNGALLRWAALVATSAFALALPGRTQAVRPGGPGAERLHTVLEGFVLTPEGAPAEGALVVSSAGGRAVADVSGHYRLPVETPLDAERVVVTAFGKDAGNLVASASVALTAAAVAPVDPLLLAGGGCEPSWLPTFGTKPGADQPIRALAVFDDGSGPALYVAGDFTVVGSVTTRGIARWDGTSWSDVGGGVNGNVLALIVHDDGSGPALFVGGTFTDTGGGGVTPIRIAKWDGASWAELDGGTNSSVRALAVYDDGGGPRLYAAGDFTSASGVPANRIARWDGTSWSALGQGTNLRIHALAVHDDGGGSRLFAGGEFTSAGGVTARKIAAWDGASWSALGDGLEGSASPRVLSLAVSDVGGVPLLYAGGSFTTAGGVPAQNIARWNGASWAALGSGVDNLVNAMTVYDDGVGPALYAGGGFTSAGGAPASKVARWDGASWSPLGTGLSPATVFDFALALAVHDFGPGPAVLCVGGAFASADGTRVKNLALWDGALWKATGRGLDDHVATVAAASGGGTVLHAGGDFTTAGNASLEGIAAWDGAAWSAFGPGLLNGVYALAMFDDGAGPALHAGGNFALAGGVSVNKVARWDGASWSPLGTGVSGISARVMALAEYDDGGGGALYAGGLFTNAGGVAASNIARWDGTSWSALGSGTNQPVHALATFDDGSGPALYAGGSFTIAGGGPASRIARWDGASWTPLGSGVSAEVHALAVHDDGDGPALYAGGRFLLAGGAAASRIAKWDGAGWSPLAGGIGAGANAVFALASHDDGVGPALYVGGDFEIVSGVVARNIARWDGASWSPLGSGANDHVYALTSVDGGNRPMLCAGGVFTSAGETGDSFIGLWGCEPRSRVRRVSGFTLPR